MPEGSRENAPGYDLDDLDVAILRALRRDARKSARALARDIGRSPGTVTERISRMESVGIIKGYHAQIDPVALGLNIEVMIGLQTQQNRPLKEIIDELLLVPEVVSVHVVSGQWDLVVTAQARDSYHLREVLMDKVWSITGFHHSETMLLLERYVKMSPEGE